MTEIKDDASLWWQSRNSENQDYEVPERPITSFVEIDDDNNDELKHEDLTNKDLRSNLNMIKLNEPVAGIVTDLMNSLIPVIITLLIKNADSNDLKLTDSEHETLVSAWAQYLRDTNVQMKPGVVLLGTIAIIYGSKITLVLSDRKRKIEDDNTKQVINKLMLRINELEERKNKENEA